MTTSFGNLLRQSKLATYDRTISQVYTTPIRRKLIGDWGLKRNLPTVIRTKFLTVGALDTSEHQTPWESGESQVLFVKRWKENFPNSEKPKPRSETVQHNLATMTPAEFQRFLRQSQKKAKAFQQAVAKKELVPDQLYDYLNVNLSDSADDTTNSVVGPTYSDHQVGWDYPVHGRILNLERQGFVAGIGGVAASLPKRNSIGLRNTGDRRARILYVHSAQIDPQGKPRVEVTLKPKGSSSEIPLLNNYESYDASFDRYANRNYNNNQLNGIRLRKQRTETPDNSTPNPEHTDLMARIADLLDSSEK
ncbi:hypothetical protein BD770DRAFT_384538 [Pilaira anomala]|nr:hypothetical protein BD770DRAFT_384538 [Pilaira anomala]